MSHPTYSLLLLAGIFLTSLNGYPLLPNYLSNGQLQPQAGSSSTFWQPIPEWAANVAGYPNPAFFPSPALQAPQFFAPQQPQWIPPMQPITPQMENGLSPFRYAVQNGPGSNEPQVTQSQCAPQQPPPVPSIPPAGSAPVPPQLPGPNAGDNSGTPVTTTELPPQIAPPSPTQQPQWMQPPMRPIMPPAENALMQPPTVGQGGAPTFPFPAFPQVPAYQWIPWGQPQIGGFLPDPYYTDYDYWYDGPINHEIQYYENYQPFMPGGFDHYGSHPAIEQPEPMQYPFTSPVYYNQQMVPQSPLFNDLAPQSPYDPFRFASTYAAPYYYSPYPSYHQAAYPQPNVQGGLVPASTIN